MKIFYLTSHSVYNPGANANRLLCISRGLVALGHNVSIIHTATIDNPNYKINNTVYGNIIAFYYRKKKYTIFGRLSFALLSFFSSLKSYFLVSQEARLCKVFVISLDTLFLNKLIYFLLGLNNKVFLVKEVLEYPLYEREKLSKVKNYYYRLNYHLEYKIFKYYIPISKSLDIYLRMNVNKNIQTEIIPICVELERFSNNTTKHVTLNPYIAYCGDMSNNKDGIDILLDAFENVYRKHPNYNLVLIGSGDGSYYNSLLKKREFLLSRDNIHFIGKVERDEMPGYLQHANLLVLTRPLNKQTEGGLPTKLGEYLATGNPVIVSDVSDIKYYLKPYYAAFIVKPDSVTDATNKIIEAIENATLSNKIGGNGRKIAEDVFSEIKIAEKLIHFLQKISNND